MVDLSGPYFIMGLSPPSPEAGQAHISLVMALHFNFVLQRGGGWNFGKQLPGPHPRGLEGSSLEFGRPFGAPFYHGTVAALARGPPNTHLPGHGFSLLFAPTGGGGFCPEASRPSPRGPPDPPQPPTHPLTPSPPPLALTPPSPPHRPRPPSAHQSNATPLHYAARWGHLSVVQWLLEKGAEVAAKSTVRGDPTGQGDPGGVGEGHWGASTLRRRASFPPSPGP